MTVLDQQLGLLVAREIDEVGDERRQSLHLADELTEDLLPLGRICWLTPLEQLEIRAQAREWRAQLVRRVRDELALRLHRALELREHHIEGGRQAPELVVRCRSEEHT